MDPDTASPRLMPSLRTPQPSVTSRHIADGWASRHIRGRSANAAVASPSCSAGPHTQAECGPWHRRPHIRNDGPYPNTMETGEERIALGRRQLAGCLNGLLKHSVKRVHETLLFISQVRAEPSPLFAEEDHQLGEAVWISRHACRRRLPAWLLPPMDCRG